MAKYGLIAGRVQPIVIREDSGWSCHFGRCEYDKNKPIIPEQTRDRVESIIFQLNNGTIDEREAEKLLKCFVC